ncbi:MAG: hypothetical protein JO090_04895 [Rhizobacter sp.]|nr:hypothetical protein [Rhizobacter sp.]
MGALIAARNPQPPSGSRFECGSDPGEFLQVGELLEPRSLQFIVHAHCANAKYVPGSIELGYGGGRMDVVAKPVRIAGTTYYRIVSIGGVAAP